MSMSPEFAEAMLRVLNDNAEAMARHIATGQTVIMKPIPNPLDYPQGEPMQSPDGPTKMTGAQRKLSDLIVREHQLNATISVTFLANDDYLSDATKRMIEDELNQHIAHAFESRGLGVLNLDEWRVEFA